MHVESSCHKVECLRKAPTPQLKSKVEIPLQVLRNLVRISRASMMFQISDEYKHRTKRWSTVTGRHRERAPFKEATTPRMKRKSDV